jgi:hypothetical protein
MSGGHGDLLILVEVDEELELVLQERSPRQSGGLP